MADNVSIVHATGSSYDLLLIDSSGHPIISEKCACDQINCTHCAGACFGNSLSIHWTWTTASISTTNIIDAAGYTPSDIVAAWNVSGFGINSADEDLTAYHSDGGSSSPGPDCVVSGSDHVFGWWTGTYSSQSSLEFISKTGGGAGTGGWQAVLEVFLSGTFAGAGAGFVNSTANYTANIGNVCGFSGSYHEPVYFSCGVVIDCYYTLAITVTGNDCCYCTAADGCQHLTAAECDGKCSNPSGGSPAPAGGQPAASQATPAPANPRPITPRKPCSGCSRAKR